MLSSKQVAIANLVMNCIHCQPLSGCILSHLKGKSREEIFSNLGVLTDAGLNRIISFHECCPYRGKIAI